jgi:RNA polymerase sigma-70 factor (ECF subfamily)
MANATRPMPDLPSRLAPDPGAAAVLPAPGSAPGTGVAAIDGTDDDARLLARYAGGEHAAFERLYQRHERGVYRFFLRSVQAPPVAEELHQDVWMRVIGHAARFEPQARFTTWLYRIARNRLIDHWRAADPAVLQSLDEPLAEDATMTLLDRMCAEPTTQPEVQALDRARARDYLSAVQALPPAQREAFLLHIQAGLSLEEISGITGAGMETIKSRLRYAGAKLRTSLSAWKPQ